MDCKRPDIHYKYDSPNICKHFSPSYNHTDTYAYWFCRKKKGHLDYHVATNVANPSSPWAIAMWGDDNKFAWISQKAFKTGYNIDTNMLHPGFNP